jgi:hypothetical protein
MLIKDDKKIRQGVSPNPASYICISINTVSLLGIKPILR